MRLDWQSSFYLSLLYHSPTMTILTYYSNAKVNNWLSYENYPRKIIGISIFTILLIPKTICESPAIFISHPSFYWASAVESQDYSDFPKT